LGLTVQLEKDASFRSCGLLYSFFQDFRPGFITVAPRNSILYTLNYTALPTHEIGLGEAEEPIMALSQKCGKSFLSMTRRVSGRWWRSLSQVRDTRCWPLRMERRPCRSAGGTQEQGLEGPFPAAASRPAAPGGLARRRSAAGRVTGPRHALTRRTGQRRRCGEESLDVPASADPALRLVRGTRYKDFAHLSALNTQIVKKRHGIILF